MTTDAGLFCRVQGEGPDLVLLHPAGLDHTFMDPIARELSDFRRVLSVDLRGHGCSPDASAGMRLQDLASDVLGVIERHCEAAPDVLGISLGGMVAQVLALEHPTAIASLVLYGCTATFDENLRPVLRERGLATQAGGMGAVVDATLARWFTPRGLRTPAAEQVRSRLMSDKIANWCVTWDAIAAHDALPRLDQIKVPVLVVAGECDAATPLAEARRLADAIPGSKLVCLPDAPHMIQLEFADLFVAAVRPFLRWRSTPRSTPARMVL